MKTLKYVAAALLILLLVFVVWGRIEPFHYDVEEETAVIPGLPAAWEGRRVAQISDWQIGMWWDNPSTVAETVERILEEEPAAVLLTGDYIYHPFDGSEDEIRRAASFVRPLTEAGLPTYAILGNHDYAVSGKEDEPDQRLAERLVNAFTEIGVRVLQNENVALQVRGEETDTTGTLYLVGIGPEWPGRADVERALSGVPSGAPRLVMLHNPDTYERLPPHAAPLAVAGHTHGGQIRLPFLPDWSWLTLVRPGYVTSDGWIDKYDVPGNRLYVNRGIGFGVVPLRINCTPELTLFTLRGG